MYSEVYSTVYGKVFSTVYTILLGTAYITIDKSVWYIEEEGGRVYFLKIIYNLLLPLITARLTVQCTVKFTVQYKDYCSVLSTLLFLERKENTKGRKESVPCGLSQISQSLKF